MEVSRMRLNNNRYRVLEPARSIRAWSMIGGFSWSMAVFDGLSGPPDTIHERECTSNELLRCLATHWSSGALAR